MRAVIQRVTSAAVTVAGRLVGHIGRGLVILVGVSNGDCVPDVDYIVNKVRGLRLFGHDGREFSRSLADVDGEARVVSQFTLCGDCRHGRRPSFSLAAPPEEAKLRYEELVRKLVDSGTRVETGVFRATMELELINDGPVTVVLDSSRMF